MNNLDMSSAFEGRAEDRKKTNKKGPLLFVVGNKQNKVNENDNIITRKQLKFKTLDNNAIVDLPLRLFTEKSIQKWLEIGILVLIYLESSNTWFPRRKKK